ncbi:MAG: P-II family nitrogen regulator [Clostridia bacterium]|nr:P-II family nitrogen regulator [Clostridia bacterium]MBQ3157173.1 P-II family nitrogen regulator [Clostridia bacterium]
MELNLVMTIIARARHAAMEDIIHSMKLPLAITLFARGTATSEHLSLHGLVPTEYALLLTVADGDQTRRLMRAAKLRMFIDIPGNGIMLSVPLKSVGGGKTMAYLTENKAVTGEKPDLNVTHELICVILNEGCSDLVMAAARPAGATGGTVLAGKGTGAHESEKFLGISLANEKDVVLIVAEKTRKAAIMKAIMEKAGPGTDAASICFSLPVTAVEGLRRIEPEDEADAE